MCFRAPSSVPRSEKKSSGRTSNVFVLAYVERVRLAGVVGLGICAPLTTLCRSCGYEKQTRGARSLVRQREDRPGARTA